MNSVKKVLALALVAVMMLALSVSAFADTGTLTVSNAMKGQTYKAYKIFSAVYADVTDPSKGVTYTVPSALESAVTSPFSVSTVVASNGEKVVTLADGTAEADVLAWVKANYSRFDSTGTELTYSEVNGTASATLDHGYYYITSGLGSVITIDSLNNAVTVVDKNEAKPNGPIKTIEAQDSSIIASLDNVEDTNKKYNYAAVGSVETFQVTFNATNWVQIADSDTTPDSGSADNNVKVTEWNFTDSPTGLNIDASTVKITVNGTTIYENSSSVDTTNVTAVSGGGDSPLSITIPWVNAGGASLYATTTAGSALIPVVVTYNATVTSAAATAVAPNNVDVKYNTNTSLGTDSTKTYTYKFQIDKTDKDYNVLVGAKFQLYASDGSTLLRFDQNGTTYTYNSTGSVDTIDMTSNAVALIQGLDQDTYVLKETQAPSGYNVAEDTKIAKEVLKKVDETITDNTGVESDEGVVTVVNNVGAELPSTGGVGTTIFYVVGALLVVGAGVVLVTRRKVDSDK